MVRGSDHSESAGSLPIADAYLENNMRRLPRNAGHSAILRESDTWKDKRVVATSLNAGQVAIALDRGVMAPFRPKELGVSQKRQRVAAFLSSGVDDAAD